MKQSIFQKTEYGYETTISLPAWNAFFGKELELDVSIDEETVTNAHLHTVAFLQENQEAILNLPLSTLLEQYAELQELYGYEPEEMQQIMPDVTDIQAFRNLLSPHSICIMNEQKDGLCCIGVEAECTWDEEHDVGFMTYATQRCTIGAGDHAFNEYEAEALLEL